MCVVVVVVVFIVVVIAVVVAVVVAEVTFTQDALQNKMSLKHCVFSKQTCH